MRIKQLNNCLVLITMLLILSIQLVAQEDSLSTVELPTASISALRIPTLPLQQPFSISTYEADNLQATRQQLSLQEYISQVPGVFSLNANNYAQDLRIAIRGFGARSAFGIRGIKIVVDGIPETTPDGQGQIDNLNLGNIKRIEIIKGPAATLYGNASGGVINIQSQENFKHNFIEAGLTLGYFQMQQYQLKGGWAKNKTRVLFQGNYTYSKGYRSQSTLENTNLNLRLFQDVGKKSKFNIQANYTNSPIGDDPGGLDQDAVDFNRRSARDRNVLFQTGEAIDQFKLGAQFKHKINSQQNLTFYGFYNQRNFEGRLPFEFGGWINLQRNYVGQGGHYKYESPLFKGKNTLQIGYDLAAQSDQRQRFLNSEGIQGALTLDQIENFNNLGLYLLDHFQLNKLYITAGLRFDINQLSVEDQFLSNEDQSGERNLTALNPSLGLNYQLASRFHIYANYRTGFETPSLSELTTNPSGAAGFNEDLISLRAHNFEIGTKGLLFKNFDYDLSLFLINSEHELVPFEIFEFPDRTFFRNAGRTQRLGLEWSGRYQFTTNLSLKTSYTYSQFKYSEFQTSSAILDGNLLPGIPKHMAAFLLSYESKKGFNIRLQHRFLGKFFADDANDVSIPAYQITDLSLGYLWVMKKMRITPFFGINNILDQDYNDNVRLNAFGGRYFEPAAGLNFYGGFRIRLHN